jgi:predicted aspartyl protease
MKPIHILLLLAGVLLGGLLLIPRAPEIEAPVAEELTPIEKPAAESSLLESDFLFRSGHFAKADAGYAELLLADPANVKALIQRGYIALLENRLADAEALLVEVEALAPRMITTTAFLAEIAYRQDQFDRAADLLGKLERTAMQAKLKSFEDLIPYEAERLPEVHVPFVKTDPLPIVQVRINDSDPAYFFIDTGAAEVIVDAKFAKEIGLETRGWERVSETVLLGHARVDTLVLGDLIVRNVPVGLLDVRQFSDTVFGGMQIDGTIGTVFLYHFLSTLDYPNAELILRPRTDGALEAFEEQARAQQAIVTPFWMAGDHFLLAKGTVNRSDPLLFLVDTGLAERAFMAKEDVVREFGIELDESLARPGYTISGVVEEIPFTVAELTLGEAVEHDLDGVTGTFQVEDMFGFHIDGLISHQFFLNYALTLDFTGMRLFLIPRE